MNDFNNAEINFLSIVMHKPEILDMTIVKPEFFENKSLSKLYKIISEMKEYNPPAIVQEGFNDLELMLYVYEQFIYESSYISMFKHFESLIINHYKTKLLDILNVKLLKREISYDNYKGEFEKIDDIRPINAKQHPDQEELISIITEEKKYIELGKFKKLSKVLKLLSDDTVTIAGPPGFGKSAMLLNLFSECIENKDNYCQYYNLEINDKQVIRRLIALDSKERMIDLKRNIDKENVKKALNKFSSYDYFIFDNPVTLERLIAEITSHLKKDKQNIVFVDYLGLIGVEDRDYNRNQYSRVTHIMKELRKLCRKYNFLMFIVSQCDRDSLKKNKLTLHSLKDSGEVENSSTHVILIYPSENKDVDFEFCENVIVDTAKNRNNYTFAMEMNFIKNKQLFIEKDSIKDVRN